MNDYEAPTIVGQEKLRASLIGVSRSLDSDAEIKHDVESVEGYRAPTITEERPLEGGLQIYRSEFK